MRWKPLPRSAQDDSCASGIVGRFADTLPPELDKLREEMREWYQCEEDVLTYAMFPKVAPKYFEYRQAQQMKIDSGMLDKADKIMPV